MIKPVAEVLTLRTSQSYVLLPHYIDIHHYTEKTPNRLESNASYFLEVTYPTTQLRSLINWLADRYNGKAVPGVAIVRGRYGSGKSHLLLCIAHLMESPAARQEWCRRWSIDVHLPTDVQVWVWQCINKDTPLLWDKFFDFLGCPDLSSRVNQYPDRELILSAIGQRRTVLILDEIEGWYKALDPREQRRNLNFLQVLSEIAAGSDQITLVVSLLGTVPELSQVFRRVNPFTFPEGNLDDRVNIIRQRLFTAAPPEDVVNEVAAAYASRIETASVESRNIVKRSFAQSYPFHPMLITLLLQEYPESPYFQRSRGALQLLERLFLLRGKHTDLLSLGDVDPSDPELAAILRSLEGHDGKKVDVICEEIRRLGNEVGSQRVLSSLLMLGLSPRRAGKVAVEELLESLVTPTDSLQRTRLQVEGVLKKTWFVDYIGSTLHIRYDLNIHGLVAQRAQYLLKEEVLEVISREITSIFKARARTVVACDTDTAHREIVSRHLDNGRGPIYVIMLRSLSDAERRTFTHGLMYRNLVLLIEPRRSDTDLTRHAAIMKEASLLLAAEQLHDSLDQKQRRTLDEHIGSWKSSLRHRLQNAYGRFLRWLPGGKEYVMEELDGFAASRLEDLLISEYYPYSYVKETVKALIPSMKGQPLSTLVRQFALQPGLPVPIKRELIEKACEDLIEEGLLRLVHHGKQARIITEEPSVSATSPNECAAEYVTFGPAPRPKLVPSLEGYLSSVTRVTHLTLRVDIAYEGNQWTQFRGIVGDLPGAGKLESNISLSVEGDFGRDEMWRWLSTLPPFPNASYTVTLKAYRKANAGG